VGVSVHLGASLADLHHLLRLCVPHVFPDRVLALEVGSCILTETVSDQLRHGGLWVVGTTVGEIVAGKSVLLGLNNAEFDPRVVVTAVCTSSLMKIVRYHLIHNAFQFNISNGQRKILLTGAVVAPAFKLIMLRALKLRGS